MGCTATGSHIVGHVGPSTSHQARLHLTKWRRPCLIHAMPKTCRTLRPRLHESGQIFARTNFVPGPAVYMDPCRIRANSVAVVFTRIRAKFRPVAAFDSRP